MKKVVKLLALVPPLLLTTMMLSCAGGTGTNAVLNAVAATVNGVEITEAQVNDYIQTMRQLNDLEDAAKWQSMLRSSGTSSEAVREQQIMSLALDIVIRQQASIEGLQPDVATVNAQLQQAKDAVAADDDAWAAQLRQFGFSTEEQYRAKLEVQDLAGQLRMRVVPAHTPTPEELRSYVETNAARYAGKRSSRIVLLRSPGLSEADLLAHASSIRERLNQGAELAVVAAEYTQATNAPTMNGDMGWDAMNAFGEAYQLALDALQPGEVSDPVVTEAGVVVIKCTDSYQLPKDANVVYELVPDALRQLLSDQLAVSQREREYQEYLSGLLRAATINIVPMPQGLPYA
ncbi:MAG: peptidylprolyl isomerase [Propionibacteriaceae bacterium]|nr:peptidylprolyl isomerase [Propionibacteriaceae bacterium]